jgi:hypothetical protein
MPKGKWKPGFMERVGILAHIRKQKLSKVGAVKYTSERCKVKTHEAKQWLDTIWEMNGYDKH